jgi:hypothetical protein
MFMNLSLLRNIAKVAFIAWLPLTNEKHLNIYKVDACTFFIVR